MPQVSRGKEDQSMTLKELRLKRQRPRTHEQIRANLWRGKRRKEMARYALRAASRDAVKAEKRTC